MCLSVRKGRKETMAADEDEDEDDYGPLTPEEAAQPKWQQPTTSMRVSLWLTSGKNVIMTVPAEPFEAFANRVVGDRKYVPPLIVDMKTMSAVRRESVLVCEVLEGPYNYTKQRDAEDANDMK